MNIDPDAGLMKMISGWLWTLLAVPGIFLWKKATNAASRDELSAAIADMRDMGKTLFANAEADRRRMDDKFTEQTTSMHGMYRELRDKIDQRNAGK